MNRLRAQVDAYNKTIHLGFFSTATYSNGTSVALVARVNNYGTIGSNGHIPPRPFLTTLPALKKKEWASLLTSVLSQEISKHGDFTKALEMAHNVLAEQAKADVQNAIIYWLEPPNKPSTIKKKKSSNPLVDTGFLKSSVTYEIK